MAANPISSSSLGDLFTACVAHADDPDRIVPLLEPILRDPETISLINHDRGYRIAYEKPGGVTILLHHHPKEVWSQPHDHGITWVIYGVVTGKTAMYEYTAVDKKRVRQTSAYWVMPGECHLYRRGDIHSHWTHDDSRLIRIEGINMHAQNKVGGRRYERAE